MSLTHWPLHAACVWVATRDEALADHAAALTDQVERLAAVMTACDIAREKALKEEPKATAAAKDAAFNADDPSPEEEPHAGAPAGACLTTDEACALIDPFDVLRHALATGYLVASGEMTEGRPEPISAEFWASRDVGAVAVDAKPWKRVTISRDAVKAAFPPVGSFGARDAIEAESSSDLPLKTLLANEFARRRREGIPVKSQNKEAIAIQLELEQRGYKVSRTYAKNVVRTEMQSQSS